MHFPTYELQIVKNPRGRVLHETHGDVNSTRSNPSVFTVGPGRLVGGWGRPPTLGKVVQGLLTVSVTILEKQQAWVLGILQKL